MALGHPKTAGDGGGGAGCAERLLQRGERVHVVGGVPAGSIRAPWLGSVLAKGLPGQCCGDQGCTGGGPGTVEGVWVLLHPHELALSRQRFLGGPGGELRLCRGCPLHPEEEEEEAGGQRGRQRAPPPATARAVKPPTKRLSLPTYRKAKQGPAWFWCCALGAMDDPHGGRWCRAPPRDRCSTGASSACSRCFGTVPAGLLGGAVHAGYSFLTYFAGGCQKVCQELRASWSGLSGQGHQLLYGFAPLLLVLLLFLLDLPPFLASFARQAVMPWEGMPGAQVPSFMPQPRAHFTFLGFTSRGRRETRAGPWGNEEPLVSLPPCP